MLTKKDICRTWTLKSWMASAQPEDQFDDQFQVFWADAHGQLIYTPDGQMSVIIIHPEWERTGILPDRGFREGAIAYSGSYTIISYHIEHHVRHTNIRPWIDQTLLRQASLMDGVLTLTSPIIQDTQGESAIHQLTWVRSEANR